MVHTLKRDRPQLSIELNGGLESLDDCVQQLELVDGAMVGRAAYAHPLQWRQVDQQIYADDSQPLATASSVVGGLVAYAEQWRSRGGRLWPIARHLVHVVEGRRRQTLAPATHRKSRVKGRGCWRAGSRGPIPGRAGLLALGATVEVATTAIATATAAAAGTPSVEAVATSRIASAIAPIFPAAGTRSPIATTRITAAATCVTTTTACSTTTAAVVATAAAATCVAATTASSVTAATTAAITTPARATTTSSAAAGAGLRFVDAQGTTHQLSTLQCLNGLCLCCFIAHLNKSETTLAPGIPFKG